MPEIWPPNKRRPLTPLFGKHWNALYQVIGIAKPVSGVLMPFSSAVKPESVQRPGPETSSMSDKCFLDTNILIYAIDASPGESPKRDLARETLKRHIRDENGVISIQVLQEFYQTATHKSKPLFQPRKPLNSCIMFPSLRRCSRIFIWFWQPFISTGNMSFPSGMP